MLEAKKITFRVGKKFLLKETSVSFTTGKFHVIMGANGAGKSTLLKLLSGEQKPSSGEIYLGSKELKHYTKSDLATRRAVLSQHYHLAFPVTAEEIVLMGRYPYFGTRPSANDLAICREATQLMDALELMPRDYTTLSGGEAQKVQMSRVLAQIWNEGESEKKVLFLDEPVSHLDVKYQHQLMKVARGLCESGTTVIAVLHDVNLALRFADRLLLMKEGEIRYETEGPGELTAEMLEDVFGIMPVIFQPAEGAKPVVLF